MLDLQCWIPFIPGSPIVAVAFSVPKAVPVHFSASAALAARFFTEKALDFGLKKLFFGGKFVLCKKTT